jgi:hypothetical protein
MRLFPLARPFAPQSIPHTSPAFLRARTRRRSHDLIRLGSEPFAGTTVYRVQGVSPCVRPAGDIASSPGVRQPARSQLDWDPDMRVGVSHLCSTQTSFGGRGCSFATPGIPSAPSHSRSSAFRSSPGGIERDSSARSHISEQHASSELLWVVTRIQVFQCHASDMARGAMLFRPPYTVLRTGPPQRWVSGRPVRSARGPLV